MSSTESFRALRIHNDAQGYRATLETLALDDLSPGEVVIKTAYSSVNYKDALAGTQLKEAGAEVMNIWNELDRGQIKEEQAFEEADKAVRRRTGAMENDL